MKQVIVLDVEVEQASVASRQCRIVHWEKFYSNLHNVEFQTSVHEKTTKLNCLKFDNGSAKYKLCYFNKIFK